KTVRRFCGLTCAREWPGTPPSASWTVRDEVTGRDLDAGLALFVVSRRPTPAPRPGCTHIFKEWRDAVAHAGRFGGSFVANPLARRPGSASASRAERRGAAGLGAGGAP